MMTTFPAACADGYRVIPFSLTPAETELTRMVPARPFVPRDERERADRCEEILSIQATGLRKRLEHSRAKPAVLGLSGGLDSTLALLVCARAMALLGRCV